MRLIDISPPLTASTPVFPGDAPFSSTQRWTISADCPVNVSTYTMSVHAGAHADAPLHYDRSGAPIDEVSLDAYIGPCSVVHAMGCAPLLNATSLATRIGARRLQPRILIRFHDQAPQLEWDADFPALAPDAVGWLADKGVILIGVDTQSLDPATSKTMDAHRAVRQRDMRILENLVLDEVPEGEYELIAPPLKLKGLDAAPVRAVLRTLE